MSQKIFYDFRNNSKIKELQKFHSQSSSPTCGRFSELTDDSQNPIYANYLPLTDGAELLKQEKFSHDQHKSGL
jgi:hypothetical protein